MPSEYEKNRREISAMMMARLMRYEPTLFDRIRTLFGKPVRFIQTTNPKFIARVAIDCADTLLESLGEKTDAE